jgi:hypothetical protein
LIICISVLQMRSKYTESKMQGHLWVLCDWMQPGQYSLFQCAVFWQLRFHCPYVVLQDASA